MQNEGDLFLSDKVAFLLSAVIPIIGWEEEQKENAFSQFFSWNTDHDLCRILIRRKECNILAEKVYDELLKRKSWMKLHDLLTNDLQV